MLAQTTDLLSVNIAAWLACLAFLVTLVNGVLKITDRFAGRPLNGNVATQEEVQKVAAAVEATKNESTGRRRAIYQRIDEVEEATNTKVKHAEDAARAEIAALREQYHKDLKEVNSRIDNIPDRMIATLRNTGVIK